MTGTTRSSSGLDERRRRLLYRSWHRGLREMDLIMGRFVDATIDRLDDTELDALERLMEVPDPEVYAWVLADEAPPAHDSPLLQRLRAFHRQAGNIGERR
jgi:antitoxin CptB